MDPESRWMRSDPGHGGLETAMLHVSMYTHNNAIIWEKALPISSHHFRLNSYLNDPSGRAKACVTTEFKVTLGLS